MSFVTLSDSNNYAELRLSNDDFEDTIIISPSKQFAIMKVQSTKNNHHYLMVVDIVNKSINRMIWNFEWKELSYWYWLSDDIVTLFSEKKETRWTKTCNLQFVYKCDFKDSKSKFELIQKRYIPVAGYISRYSICAPVRIKRTWQVIELNGHDFLFVNPYEFQLFPFNPLGGPSLPEFSLNLVDFFHRFYSEGHEGFFTMPNFQFACYKNKIYFQLNRKELTDWTFICDRFFVIELTDFNLTTRKIETAPLDFDNPNIVTFRRLTEGTFVWGLPMPLIWQEGPIVLFYERSYNRQDEPLAERRVVIVDLENETVREKIIKQKFTKLTFYRGYLLLWNISETDGSVSFKFEFLNDHPPKLVDICTIKLLSQPNKNKEFTEIYDKITRKYH